MSDIIPKDTINPIDLINTGKLRLGEMERDAIISHSNSFGYFPKEKLCDNFIDTYTLYVCDNCGSMKNNFLRKQDHTCRICKKITTTVKIIPDITKIMEAMRIMNSVRIKCKFS